MTISELSHKNVCVLGYGREGRATVAALSQFAPECKITIADADPQVAKSSSYPHVSGPDYLEKLTGFDLVIKSPGIAWHPSPHASRHLTSATELFLLSKPASTRVIGVTGTKGKSTTASLIYHALLAAGQSAIFAGNIGDPVLSHLSEANEGTTFVLELSSYQLETLRVSPEIAVITSLYPDHLDYHGSLKNYYAAKRHIAEFQHPEDIVFYNSLSPDCLTLAKSSPGRHVPFAPDDFPGKPSPNLANPAGRSNLAAAYLVARFCGVSKEQAIQSLESAAPLPHRVQPLGLHHGIQWIDDSAATTPQSTIAALDLYETAIFCH